MTTPTTEAGRALPDVLRENGVHWFIGGSQEAESALVLAIEAEARQQERERIADILAALNHASGEDQECLGDDRVWCDPCRESALDMIRPDSDWGIAVEARQHRAALEGEQS